MLTIWVIILYLFLLTCSLQIISIILKTFKLSYVGFQMCISSLIPLKSMDSITYLSILCHCLISQNSCVQKSIFLTSEICIPILMFLIIVNITIFPFIKMRNPHLLTISFFHQVSKPNSSEDLYSYSNLLLIINSPSLNYGIFLTSLYALILTPSKLFLEIKFKFFKIILGALHDLSSAYFFCFISCYSYQQP